MDTSKDTQENSKLFDSNPETSSDPLSFPIGTSFISYSDIENPQIDTTLKEEESLSLETEPVSIPRKSDSYSTILPQVEPFYKRYYSDKSSEGSSKQTGFECEFFIRYETTFGQQIVLVGNSADLGSWNVFKGVPLAWGPEHLWSAKVFISSLPLEYKYVLMSDEKSLWESGSNRKLLRRTEEVIDYWQEF
jgi:hypothetical protein